MWDKQMKRQPILTAVILGVMLILTVPKSKGQDCNFPPKALTEGEHRDYHGLYENKAYGYSVSIPAGYIGHDGVNPFYQKGFGIILDPEPKSYIVVDSEKNSLEFAQPVDAASRMLEYLGKHGNKVVSSKITESHLGSLSAALVVAAYTCSGAPGQYIESFVVAISPDKRNLYEITLYSRPDRFERDRAVLDALVESWKQLGQ
jgi:hypothetical protein